MEWAISVDAPMHSILLGGGRFAGEWVGCILAQWSRHLCSVVFLFLVIIFHESRRDWVGSGALGADGSNGQYHA